MVPLQGVGILPSPCFAVTPPRADSTWLLLRRIQAESGTRGLFAGEPLRGVWVVVGGTLGPLTQLSPPCCRLPPSHHQGCTLLCHHDQHIRVQQEFLPAAEPRGPPGLLKGCAPHLCARVWETKPSALSSALRGRVSSPSPTFLSTLEHQEWRAVLWTHPGSPYTAFCCCSRFPNFKNHHSSVSHKLKTKSAESPPHPFPMCLLLALPAQSPMPWVGHCLHLVKSPSLKLVNFCACL